MYKVRNHLAPSIVNGLFFKDENPYDNLTYKSHFCRPVIKSVYNATESIASLGPKIWDLLAFSIKEINQLETFKEGIKEWKLYTVLADFAKFTFKVLVFIEKETLNVKKKKIQQISKFCVVFCFNFLCSTVLVVQLETRQVRFVLQINRLISIWFPVIQDT